MNPSITLPDGRKCTVEEVTATLTAYPRYVHDLFDASLIEDGDRDEFTALDLLSLAALNAAPTAEELGRLWDSTQRRDAEKLLTQVPRGRVERLSDDEIAKAAETLAGVAEKLLEVKGWKDTRVGKLVHRMRPGLAPIWDTLVGHYYKYGPWKEWYATVMHQVKAAAPQLQAALDAVPSAIKTVSPMRVWDILLWSKAPGNRSVG